MAELRVNDSLLARTQVAWLNAKRKEERLEDEIEALTAELAAHRETQAELLRRYQLVLDRERERPGTTLFCPLANPNPLHGVDDGPCGLLWGHTGRCIFHHHGHDREEELWSASSAPGTTPGSTD